VSAVGERGAGPSARTTRSPYHTGELTVQARAGVRTAAARVGGIVQSEIPHSALEFLAQQQFAVVGGADADGRVWASLLTGDPGMLRAPDPRTLHVAVAPPTGDPLTDTLAGPRDPGSPVHVGVLILDVATRRRLRVNGVAEPASGGGVVVGVREAYWICPKYIQRRLIERPPVAGPVPASGGDARPAGALSEAQRGWVTRADTFFIASSHPAAGADASHRGGTPGFVRLERGPGGEDVLVFPDYPGNNMFNTFGNLAVNPAAGLLFVDFERGTTLQLTGTADVMWERELFAAWPGAERAVRFGVAEALEVGDATRLRWRLVERSPFNPPPPLGPPRRRPP
jgi:predicted pyridoxine 5'-phosphate oxidase superfamily flavin-nucleotide-binding protein